MSAALIPCPECQRQNQPAFRFCSFCGGDLAGPRTTTTATTTTAPKPQVTADGPPQGRAPLPDREDDRRRVLGIAVAGLLVVVGGALYLLLR